MNGSWIITIVLLILLAAALPIWKFSKPWGYTAAGWLGVMLAAHFFTIATSHA